MRDVRKKLVLPKRKVRLVKPELGPTERRWMSWESNGFEALTVLQENNSTAFDILVNVMGMGDAVWVQFAKNIDDMNIRGEQIGIAFLYAQRDLNSLIELVNERSKHLVDYINAKWKRAFMERAVTAGAHKRMHKKIYIPPNVR
jgi:response regulator RpfG family c-di-GMP phosphodiesterase